MKKYVLFCLLSIGILFASCTKQESKKLILDNDSTQLHQLETFVITSNGTNITYESRDKYVASVKENGEVTAVFVGETIIDVRADEGTAEFKVTVNGKYNTFEEPCHDWAKTKSEVFAMYPSLTFDQSGSSWIAMADKNRAISYIYQFDSSDKLSSATITIHEDYALDCIYFLSERYMPITESAGYYFFVNGLSQEAATTTIAMSKMPGYKLYMIMYMPYTSSKAINGAAGQFPCVLLPDSLKE